MKKQIYQNEIPGRTIDKITDGYGRLIISFTDGTFAAYMAESDGDDCRIDDLEIDIRYAGKLPDLQLHEIFTAEEESGAAEKLKIIGEELDRRQYEQLRKRFEASSEAGK